MSGRAGETHLMGGSAQLTVFYSGTVNVYEDVPADKAHAIMLLLSNGNSRTSSGSCDEYNRPGTSTSSKPAQVINADQPTANTNTFHSVGAGVQLIRSSTSACSSPHRIEKKQQQQKLVIRRPQAELPFARKASLARFLEKRKDRVDAKLIKEASSMAVKVNPGSPACKKMKL